MTEKKLGAQLYTARQYTKTPEGVFDTLKKVKAIGYSAVQVSGFGPVDPADVAKALKDNELVCAGTHMNWTRFQNDIDAVIKEHKMWGCVNAAIGGLPAEYHTADGLKKFIDEVPKVCEALAKEGITFSYHNHNLEFAKYGGKTWLAQLYDAVPGKLLKAEIDVYWVTEGGGDPIEWVNKVAGRMPMVHFKDMMVKMPEKEKRMAEIGEGNLNWKGIVDACEKTGVRWYLVEQDNCYDRDPLESLKISFENLKAMGLS
mgnify:CR=1 FL=1